MTSGVAPKALKSTGMKNLDQQRVENAEYDHHADPVSDNSLCSVLFPCSQMERKPRGASDPDQERDGKADGRQGIGDICSGVPQISPRPDR